MTIAPLGSNAEGVSYLTDGNNQSSYLATANQFAGNPNPAEIPALGIMVQSPQFIGDDSFANIQPILNRNGAVEMATLTYTFSEPITDPIIDLSGIGGICSKCKSFKYCGSCFFQQYSS
ncbi:hypothetical protein [Streptococcus sp. 20-1249]|uniref:hypothetical protein n=1 Tax=Streptococcus hepaticus TaxID=3349163 RepID=UPI003749CD6D